MKQNSFPLVASLLYLKITMKEGKRKALVHDNEKSFILLVSFNRLSLISLLYIKIIISRKKLSTIKEKKS
jgi:hypothetical protein